MQASQSKIQSIIEGTKQYLVPLFQRPYSWGRKEWSTLWSDLMDLYYTSNPRPHFLGSLVTMQVVTVPEGVAKYTLIDGQQRLTTIFIILIVIRNYAIECENTDLADEINYTLLVNQFKKDSDYYKLMPTQDDRDSFKKLIDKNEILKDDPINSAYKFFDIKLRKNSPDISRLKDIISSSLIIVSIVLDYDDNPHLVFEGLNAKGRPLTQADLIRNYLLMKIHTDKQEKIFRDLWEPMQNALQENLTEFIRHYLISDGSEVKQGDIYYALKERVSSDNAVQFLSELSEYSNYYEKLLYPGVETNKNIEKRLDKLRKIEMSTAYPFILRCYEDYATNNLSRDEFIETLDTIINFGIRRYICNIPTNQLNKIFPPLYNQVKNTNEKNFNDGLKGILKKKGYPRDIDFINYLIISKIYGGGNRSARARLLLETIEEYYGHKEVVDSSNVTIEHIMPQSLSEDWQNELGDNWEEIHENIYILSEILH